MLFHFIKLKILLYLIIIGLCHYCAFYPRYSRKLCTLDWLNILNSTVLINNQFGFRKLHSSYMALMVLMNELISSLEKGESVIGVFLDFSKAFDIVDHAILLCKLENYGIRGNALSWFKSYLTDHEQFVRFNGVSSATKLISCGVPQGSILGPLLFLIYINDLHAVCKNTFPILIADDTNLFTTGTDFDVMQNTLNDELNEISTWLKVNKLSLNVKKTHYMIFTRKKMCKKIYYFENQWSRY